jgi:stearoyl-CoA desaturase (Delta-9 desaturase)
MDLLVFGIAGAFPWWVYLSIGGMSTFLTIFTVTLYLHRSRTHAGVEFHAAVNHVFAFWQWFTTPMTTREWVAVHRKHHVFADGPDDPHSPQGKGFWAVLFLVRDYVRAARSLETIMRYGHQPTFVRRRFPEWHEPAFYARHRYGGIALSASLAVSVFGLGPGGLIVLAHVLWIPFWAACVVNGVGHRFGARNFSTPDESRNIVPWGVVIGGEELHNNHHAYPTSAKFSYHWYEVDVGWGVIRFLAACGLAHVKHVAPHPVFVSDKTVCDEATLRSVCELRYLVMEWFDEVQWLTVGHAIELRHFRRMLIALWMDRARRTDELVGALRIWHKQALASGIPALTDLARRIARLSVKRPSVS